MSTKATEPRPPVNQGIDTNNATVLRHNQIYETLLSHVTEGSGNVYLSVNPYGTAPLSGYLGLWATSVNPVGVRITDDIGSIPVEYSYTPVIGANLVPLVGLSPEAANTVTITIPGVGTANGFILTTPLPVSDAELPAQPDGLFQGFPIIEASIPAIDPPDTINELYFCAFAQRHNVGIDPNGIVRWYTSLDIPVFNLERISNGHFMSTGVNFGAHQQIYEFDMVGRVYNVYVLDNQCHHSIYQLPDGNLLIPSENTGTTLQDGVSVVDISTGLETAYYDMRYIMDMNRYPRPRFADLVDWLHINQAYLNTTNNLMVVSARHQGVFALNADTSELAFILGNHQDWGENFQQYLLTPVDDEGNSLYDLTDQDDIDKADKEFWQWGQHACLEVPNSTAGIVEFFIFDNGNYRSRDDEKALIPNDNYSRIVHYKVDLSNMTVMKLFEYGKTEVGNRGYSAYVSNQQVLDNGNYFINFGGGNFDENGRRRGIHDGYGDIIDPLTGNLSQGIVVLQEINPDTKEVQVEFTCTSGRFKSPETDSQEFFDQDLPVFRAYKLPLIP